MGSRWFVSFSIWIMTRKTELDLEKYLAERAAMVEQALQEVLPQTEDQSARVVEAMRYSLLVGGKRLRPVLCMAGAEAVGAEAREALPAAVALEMIHTSSLIHDDLPGMDDDDLRRGKPSNHKAFGVGMAILAGDGLLIEGLGHLAAVASRGLLPHDTALAALHVIERATGWRGMVGGQSVDIASEGQAVGEDVVGYIHAHKTAALIAASVVAGGILGAGTEAQVRSLDIFGQRMGVAFQIVDDILDIVGNTAEMGKPSGSDQARGKATYPMVVGLEKAKQTAAGLRGEALGALETFGAEADPLRALAEYLIVRKK